MISFLQWTLTPHYFMETFTLTLIQETNSLWKLNFSIHNTTWYTTHSYTLLCGYPTITPLYYMATLSSPTWLFLYHGMILLMIIVVLPCGNFHTLPYKISNSRTFSIILILPYKYLVVDFSILIMKHDNYDAWLSTLLESCHDLWLSTIMLLSSTTF
jgi:hypothetical protein